MSRPWFQKWFNDFYPKLYQHRSEAEAQRQVSFVLSLCTPKQVCDVACGAARHLRAFEAAGVQGFGVDLSMPLLRLSEPGMPLCRADMRSLPFADERFSLLTSFFTSFGYFETDREHQDLLREWNRVLTPSGYLFIDYLNPEYIEANLEAESETQLDEYLVIQRRSIVSEPMRVLKDIAVFNIHTNDSETFQESVRMYRFDTLHEMLANAGFELKEVFGGFSGEAYSSESPRMILFAQRRS